MENQELFWQALERLVAESEIVIDRPKQTAHPKYSDMIYPLDYGYLKNTTAMDGGGIDVYVGSDEERTVKAVLCIVDLLKRDSEIKILIGCTKEEIAEANQFQNHSNNMKALLIYR